MSPATSTYFNDHKLQGMLHLKVLRSPHSHARIRRIDLSEAERHPGVAPHHPRRRRAAQSQHAAQPHQLRQGRRADARRRQGALQGRADRRRRRRQPARGLRGDGQDPRRLRAAADRVRRRGGDEARRAGRQRDLSEEHVHLSRHLRPSEAALRRRRARLRRRPTTCSSSAIRCRRSSMRRRRPTARSPRPTPTGAMSSTPRRRRLFFSLDTCAKILDVPSNTLHFIGGTVGGGFGGKVDTVTEPLVDSGRDADGQAGALHDRPRGGDASIAPPRGAERIYIKDGVSARRAHPRAQVAGLFRQRRLYAAVELRRRQMRRASAGALHDPECLTPTSIASSPTGCRRPRCAASASPRSISPSNARWTSSPISSAWTRWSSASSTPIATAT